MGDLAVWSAQPLSKDVRRSLERLAASDDVVRVAAMPDVHLAEEVCVGAVVATRATLYPNAVGGDIGCGMATIRTSLRRVDVDSALLRRLLDAFDRAVPIMTLRSPASLPESLQHAPSSSLAKDAAHQLGTLGRGNHFLELQLELQAGGDGDDSDGAIWLAVHSGSRGIGQALRAYHVKRCKTSSTGHAYLDADSADGIAYLDDVRWALAFAELNRDAMLHAAAGVLHDVAGADCDADSAFACVHNFVERAGELWIHRKGANRALDDERAIIPGSMGSTTFHVAGRGNADALWSSSHGAGRAMSRSEARVRVHRRQLLRELDGVVVDERKLAHLVDEAPSAYKDISKVMRAQRDLVRVVRRLTPLVSHKGA